MDRDLEIVGKLKLLLHLYCRNGGIEKLVNLISNSFDIFSIDYNESNTIFLRIKKSNIKKNCDIREYYTNTLSYALSTFIAQEFGAIRQFSIALEDDMLTDESLEKLKDINIIRQLFGILILSDNVVTIQI